MKRLLLIPIVALTALVAFGQAMRTYNGTNDLVSASHNPSSANTNAWVVDTNDFSYTQWTWWPDPTITNTAGPLYLESLRPGVSGSYVMVENLHWNRSPDLGGTNIIIWINNTNQGGLVGALTVPYLPRAIGTNKLADSHLYWVATGTGTDTNLYFGPGTTNFLRRIGNDVVLFASDSVGGIPGYFAVTNLTDPSMAYFGSGGNEALVRGKSGVGLVDALITGRELRWGNNTFFPLQADTHLGIAPGNSGFLWGQVHASTNYDYGYRDITQTNDVRLRTSMSGTTGIFNIESKTNNVLGPITGFKLQTNGVDVASFGTGGSSIVGNWTFPNATDASLAGVAMARELRDTNNVMSFAGVTAGGVLDDAPAIQAAINLCTNNLYFPPGVYLLKSTLTLTNVSGIHGAGLTTVFRVDATFTGVDVLLVTNCPAHFVISDLVIEMTSAPTITAIHQINCQEPSLISNVTIKGDVTNGGNGVLVDSTAWGGVVTVNDCKFSTLNNGIIFTNTTGASVISQNKFWTGVGATNRCIVFGTSTTGGTTINDNQFETVSTAIFNPEVNATIIGNRYESVATNLFDPYAYRQLLIVESSNDGKGVYGSSTRFNNTFLSGNTLNLSRVGTPGTINLWGDGNGTDGLNLFDTGITSTTIGSLRVIASGVANSFGFSAENNTEFFAQFGLDMGTQYGAIRIYQANTPVITVTNLNFGIGDTNPSEKLSVGGNIKVSGSVTAGSFDVPLLSLGDVNTNLVIDFSTLGFRTGNLTNDSYITVTGMPSTVARTIEYVLYTGDTNRNLYWQVGLSNSMGAPLPSIVPSNNVINLTLRSIGTTVTNVHGWVTWRTP